MTDLGLQAALYEEIRKMAKSYVNDELAGWVDFNVYKQDKPYKEDDFVNEETAIGGNPQENYIIVMVDDEDTNEAGEWIVQVYFIISIGEYYEEHSGNMVILDVMNEIWRKLNEKRIIGGKYLMETKAHKRINHECYPNYYEGALVTYWKLPATNTELIKDLV